MSDHSEIQESDHGPMQESDRDHGPSNENEPGAVNTARWGRRRLHVGMRSGEDRFS